MLASSLAFTWVVWRQHRWGLFVVLSSVLLSGVLAETLITMAPWYFSPNLILTLVVIPLVVLTGYAMVIFTYGLDAGDVLARESCFPPRLFRLPLRTSALVIWPMAFGAATAFLMWLAP